MSKFQRVNKGDKIYDEFPTQIVWCAFDNDYEGLDFSSGILYHGEIICLCCGCATNIYDMINEYDQFWIIYIDEKHEGEWIGLEHYIKGDCLDLIYETIFGEPYPKCWEDLKRIVNTENF